MGHILGNYQPGISNLRLIVVWSIMASYVWVLAGSLLHYILPFEDKIFTLELESYFWVYFLFSFLILQAYSLLLWIIRLFESNKKLDNLNRQIADEAKNAELNSLISFLQPHFLFNSLNSINALIGSKPEKARQMTASLSDFLRNTLQHRKENQIRLEEELQQLKLYLGLEEIRFANRMSTKLDIHEDCLNAQIPPFILQPLVENAIKFGVYDRLEETEISIKAFLDQGYLHIIIQNPCDKIRNDRSGTGFGLNSLDRRLFLIYGLKGLLQTDLQNQIFTASLKIPLQK